MKQYVAAAMPTSSLFDAIYACEAENVMSAIFDGADVNACESRLSGYTPLTLAFELGGGGPTVDSILHELYLKGADIHLANAWGGTPLLSALSVKQLPWAMEFIARGADVNVIGIVDDRLTTPLHEAAYWGQLDMVEWLIQAGANVNMRAHKQMTAQEYARTNIINGPVELTRLSRTIETTAVHPILSLGRIPVCERHVKCVSGNGSGTEGGDLTCRWAAAMKNKDWYNALMALEMGAIVPSEVEDLLREKRYTDATCNPSTIA